MSHTPPWFTIRAQSGGIADVAIEGTIDVEGAARLCAALPRGARTIRLGVTSLGGDPTAAMSIAKTLRAHPARVEVTITGIAASAATLPVMAGNHVVIDAGAVAMVHNPHLIPNDTTPRDARALRTAAAELDRIKSNMLDVYAWRVKAGREELARLLDTTTWLDPAEAVRLGLADEVGAVSQAARAAAAVDAVALAILGPIPARFRDRVERLGSSARHDRGPLLDVQEIYRRLNAPAPAFNALDYYRTGGTR